MENEISAERTLTIWQLTDLVVDEIPGLNSDRRSARTTVRNRFQDQLAKGKIVDPDLIRQGQRGFFSLGAFCDWVRAVYEVPLDGLPHSPLRTHKFSASGNGAQSDFVARGTASSLDACQERLLESQRYVIHLQARLKVVEAELDAARKVIAMRTKRSNAAKRASSRVREKD